MCRDVLAPSERSRALVAQDTRTSERTDEHRLGRWRWRRRQMEPQVVFRDLTRNSWRGTLHQPFVHSSRCFGEGRPPGANRNLRAVGRNRPLPPGPPLPRPLRRRLAPVRTPEKALHRRTSTRSTGFRRVWRGLRVGTFIRKSLRSRSESSTAEEKEEDDRLTSMRSIDPRSITSTSMKAGLFRFLNGHHPSAFK